MNKMREIMIDKITINMGVGNNPEELDKAKKIAEIVTKEKVILTRAKTRQPQWNLRPGTAIGIKTTLRKNKAMEFLKEVLKAKKNTLKKECFDDHGNFAFGIHEHIELPGVRYEPKLGIKGFDVSVTLERRGYRVKKRRFKKSKVGKAHLISKEAAINFAKESLGITVM